MTLRRRTKLQRSVPLVSRTSMRSTELKRSPMKRGRVEPKLSRVEMDELAERSGRICEIQSIVCRYHAIHPCHRIGEGSGGRHGEAAVLNDRLSNVLHGCWECHDWCHRNPLAAQHERWMLRNGSNPLTTPVHYRRTSWRLLADDGTWELCAAPEDYQEVA